MTDRQGNRTEVIALTASSILEHYNTSAKFIHYMLHNLFRGLKPVRRKYRLTINEVIFLNGMYLYCRHVSTCISHSGCVRFIGYYNLNKVKYYIGSLQDKGMIEIAEVLRGNIMYRLTSKGVCAIDEISHSFEMCFQNWFNKYDICP